MIAEVIVDIAHSEVDRIFDYIIPDELAGIEAGRRVMVSFASREIEGYIIRIKEQSDYDAAKLKAISYAMESYAVLPADSLELMFFLAKKYHLKLIDAIRLFIPAEMRGNRVKELNRNFVKISEAFLSDNGLSGIDFEDGESLEKLYPFIRKNAKGQLEAFTYLFVNGQQPLSEMNQVLSASALRNLIQRGIVECFELRRLRQPYSSINPSLKQKHTLTDKQKQIVGAISVASGKPFLLHGVTGSGKTEVYLSAIERTVQQGKTAIMLVPEISLTPQVLKAFRERFGDSVAILHSGLSAGERFDEWHRILLKEANIVIGARSAIFAPLSDIGIIIIDEEHDSSYLSENTPRYYTHEAAIFRAEKNMANLLLGSATPSIESYKKAKDGEYILLEMRERINEKPLPEIRIVDMVAEVKGGNAGIFSGELSARLNECFDSGNQAMIFINRRGFVSYMLCRQCGYIAKCDSCDVSLVFHQDENLLKCHFCNARYKALDVCPKCGCQHMRQGNTGTQKVEAEIKRLFPKARTLRMDRDTTGGKDSHNEILSQFADKRANVLIGTQMIAKGHDFPSVTLVGIIDADLSLYCNGYMGSERTFQLITQVAGRAGRDEIEGKVVLQSYQPKHYVYRYASAYDYKGFFEKESNTRETTKYPPYSKLIRILFSGEDEAAVVDNLKAVWDKIAGYIKDNPKLFYFSGKMRSPVKRISNKFRYQILLRITDGNEDCEQQLFRFCDEEHNKKFQLTIEFNPSSLS